MKFIGVKGLKARIRDQKWCCHVAYDNTFYDADKLYRAAWFYYQKLPKTVDTLISRGHSGGAIASAMLILASMDGRTLHHAGVRKIFQETSHAGDSPWAGGKPAAGSVVAIVDDFIGTRATINHILALTSVGFRLNFACIIVGSCNDNFKSGQDVGIPIIEVDDDIKAFV